MLRLQRVSSTAAIFTPHRFATLARQLELRELLEQNRRYHDLLELSATGLEGYADADELDDDVRDDEADEMADFGLTPQDDDDAEIEDELIGLMVIAGEEYDEDEDEDEDEDDDDAVDDDVLSAILGRYDDIIAYDLAS